MIPDDVDWHDVPEDPPELPWDHPSHYHDFEDDMHDRPHTALETVHLLIREWVECEARLRMACSAIGEDGVDPAAVCLQDLDPATYSQVLTAAQQAVLVVCGNLGITNAVEHL